MNKLLFDTIVNASNVNKDNLLLMGDFNCNEINWEDLTSHNQSIESLSNKIIETFRDCFLQQVILEMIHSLCWDTYVKSWRKTTLQLICMYLFINR